LGLFSNPSEYDDKAIIYTPDLQNIGPTTRNVASKMGLDFATVLHR
jgi:hypothetical protein